MRVLESLVQIEFLSHPVSSHQLLVNLFDRHHALGAPVIATLDNRETTPEEQTSRLVVFEFCLTQILLNTFVLCCHM